MIEVLTAATIDVHGEYIHIACIQTHGNTVEVGTILDSFDKKVYCVVGFGHMENPAIGIRSVELWGGIPTDKYLYVRN